MLLVCSPGLLVGFPGLLVEPPGLWCKHPALSTGPSPWEPLNLTGGAARLRNCTYWWNGPVKDSRAIGGVSRSNVEPIGGVSRSSQTPYWWSGPVTNLRLLVEPPGYDMDTHFGGLAQNWWSGPAQNARLP